MGTIWDIPSVKMKVCSSCSQLRLGGFILGFMAWRKQISNEINMP